MKFIGSLRLITDLLQMNGAFKRPIHPFQPVKDIIHGLEAGSKYFIILNASVGYWQIALAEESQKLTCFITEWGRYVYL